MKPKRFENSHASRRTGNSDSARTRRPPSGPAGVERRRGDAARRPPARNVVPQGGRGRAAAADKPRKRRKRRGSLLLFYLFFGFIAAVTGIVLSLTVLFPAQKFEIEGKTRYSREEILAALPVKKGDNLLRVDKAEAEAALTARLPYVGKAELRRKLPDTLIVRIEETKARFVLERGEAFWLLNADFRVLEEVTEPPEGLTRIRGLGTEEPAAGETLEISDRTHADRLERLLAETKSAGLDNKITLIDLTDITSVRMTYENRIVMILGTAADLNAKIRVGARIIVDEIAEDKTGTLDLSRVTEERVTAPFREKPVND